MYRRTEQNILFIFKRTINVVLLIIAVLYFDRDRLKIESILLLIDFSNHYLLMSCQQVIIKKEE